MSVAYLLIAHGSRDRRSQVAFAALAERIKPRLPGTHRYEKGNYTVHVGTAYLELSDQPLHQQIVQFVAALSAEAPLDEVHLLPLFLLPGVHVRDDIPAEVTQASTLITTPCSLHLHNYLGAHPGFVPLLRRLFNPAIAAQRILLAHGSRRPGGNRPIESTASRLQARPAYWAVEPFLSQQVNQIVAQGHREIIIQPYFLFPGGITNAITTEVDLLRQHFRNVQIHQGTPFSEAPEFVTLVVDWLQQRQM